MASNHSQNQSLRSFVGINAHNQRPLPPFPSSLSRLPHPSFLLPPHLPNSPQHLFLQLRFNPIPLHLPARKQPRPDPDPVPASPALRRLHPLPRNLRPLSFCAVLFAVLSGMVYKSLKLSGIQIEPGSNLFLGCCILAGIMMGFVLIAIQLNFSLGFVVVVVESKWGLEPLRRSAYLLKGMKAVALPMLVFYGLAIGFLAWECSTTVAYSGRATGLWSWAFVLQTVASSGFITLLMLHNVAANVVLYMYCKALRGELAFDIAEEFACEYFSLPYDYDKVPHVVSVFHE